MKFIFCKLLLILLSSLSLSVCACRQDYSGKIPPEAVEGVIDLTGWDFKRDGPVNLNGEYEFYWKRLYKPSDFSTSPQPLKTGIMKVPGYWNGHKIEGQTLTGKGYATYRLKILLNSRRPPLAIKILEIANAYVCYVNGNIVCSAGVAGETPETTVPRYSPQVVDLEIESDQIEILFQVSNFHHRRGGPWEVIQLGDESGIKTIQQKKIGFDLFIFGGIFIIALYHFGLFILRRKDRSNLYFGIFSILIALRLLITGERYLISIFPTISWELTLKLEYLSFYMAVPVFMQFMRSIFRQISKQFFLVFWALSIAFSAVVVITPARIFSHTLNAYEIITLVAFLYALYIVITEMLQKNVEAFVFIIGFLFLILTVINDMLHVERVIQTGHFAPSGFFIYIFSQAFLLSLRFTRSRKTVEIQRKELKKTLEAYKKEIIERVKAEEALRSSHERFITVLNSIDADVYVADIETYEILFMNKHMKDAFRSDWLGRTCWEVLHNSPGPCSHCTNDKLIDTEGNPTGVYIWEGKNPLSGKWYMNYDRAIKWVDDRLVRLEVATDITDLKDASEALRQSEEKYRNILHSIEDGYYEVDIAGNLIFFNNSLCNILGYSKEELMGMNNRQFMSEKTAAKVYETFNKIYRSGEAAKAVDWQAIQKDGTVKYIDTSISLMRDHDGNPIGFRGVARDVTERKRAEEWAKIHQLQLMRADKMVALGMMVSGVAHEINNPNNFIMLNASILSDAWKNAMPIFENYYEENGDFILGGTQYSEMRDKYPELFSGISSGARRIKQIVDDLKKYIMEEDIDLTQSIDINTVIKSAVRLVSNMIKKSTNYFSVDYGKNLPKIKGNFQRLEQVMINLLQNACQALSDTEKGIFVSTNTDQDITNLVICIRDEGVGIPTDTLPHITDPLFTTKPGGVGLGLSISSRIIEEHGGSMHFTSENNNGTTVEIILPVNLRKDSLEEVFDDGIHNS